MPKRVPQPETFPAIYHTVAQLVGNEGKIYRVPATGRMGDSIDTATGAVIPEITRIFRLRAHWEAFKLALKRASLSDNEQTRQHWGEAYRRAAACGFYPNKEGGFVEFRPRDKSWHAELLATGGAQGETVREDGGLLRGDVVQDSQDAFLASLNAEISKEGDDAI